ncbi:Phage T7 capsid assembly protein [Enhydrobacter aerosaccus]|uniref:Phage T7 capsid assembly protein n=1 Tax=Enhydrobacter aerosaccus TaxID=225324 RepID=A0A1T4RP37_9HYPH|nr:hypothetical protein [Enhydrobacter aerosaccus]SKA17703.1 Phage T7 capsid assembly protein [Enhydrobacter aerosaccus]
MAEIITASVPLDGSGKAPAATGTENGGAAPGGAGAQSPAPGGAAPGNDGAAPANGAAPGAPSDGDKGQAAPANPSELTKPEEKPLGNTKTEEQLRAEKVTGRDLTKFAEEFQANGKLSDESYKALEEGGFNREVVDTYIRGVQADVTTRLTNLAETVGGVENYNAILNWGKTALTDTEKAEAVKMLSGSSPETAKTYLIGLQARFTKENGAAPTRTAGGGGAPAADVFTSRAEQAKAMRDPRYKTDAKYREEVTQKSIRSFSVKGSQRRTKKAAPQSSRRARSKGKR